MTQDHYFNHRSLCWSRCPGLSLHCVAPSLLSCLQASGWGSWGQDGWGVCPVETVSILPRWSGGCRSLTPSHPLPPSCLPLGLSGLLLEWLGSRLTPPTQAALHPSGASVVSPSSLFSFLPFTSSSFSWCFCLSSWFRCRRTQVAFRHLVQQQAAERPRPPQYS